MLLGLIASCLSLAAVPSHVSSTVTIQRLDMMTRDQGWALGATSLYYTQSGGSRWTPVGPSLSSLDAVYWQPVSSTVLWMAVIGADSSRPRLYALHQRGGTVAMHLMPNVAHGVLSQIDAINTSRIYAMYTLSLSPTNERIEIYQSLNQGRSWAKAPGAAPPLRGIKSGIRFDHPLGDWITGGTVAPGQIYLYHQSSPNRPWTPIRVAVPSRLRQSVLWSEPPLFFNPRDGVLPVFVNGTDGDPDFYRTTNGGRTFNPTRPVVPIAEAAESSVSQWGFTSSENGWAWVETDSAIGQPVSAQLYETKNGGNDWTEANITPGLKGIRLIELISLKRGFAVTSTATRVIQITPAPKGLGSDAKKSLHEKSLPKRGDHPRVSNRGLR